MQAGNRKKGSEGTVQSSWYLVATCDFDAENLHNYIHLTHRSLHDIEKRDGSLWVPYKTELDCRLGVQAAKFVAHLDWSGVKRSVSV